MRQSHFAAAGRSVYRGTYSLLNIYEIRTIELYLVGIYRAMRRRIINMPDIVTVGNHHIGNLQVLEDCSHHLCDTKLGLVIETGKIHHNCLALLGIPDEFE